MREQRRWIGFFSVFATVVATSACDFVNVIAGMPAVMGYLYGKGAAVLAHPVPRSPETLLLEFRTDMSRAAFDSLARTYVAAGTLVREPGYLDSDYAYRWPAGLADAPDSTVAFLMRTAFLGDSLKGIALNYYPFACAGPAASDTLFAPALEGLLDRTYAEPLGEFVEDNAFMNETTRQAYWLEDSVLVEIRASLQRPGGKYSRDTCAVSSGSITLTGVRLERRTAISLRAMVGKGMRDPLDMNAYRERVERENERMSKAWSESLGPGPWQDDHDPEHPTQAPGSDSLSSARITGE